MLHSILIAATVIFMLYGNTNFRKAETIKYKKVKFDIFRVNLKTDSVQFNWKNEDGKIYKTLGAIKKATEAKNKTLIFAINGAIYDSVNIVKGLYIENSLKLSNTDTTSNRGNYYLKPNGVLKINYTKTAQILTTENYFGDSLSNKTGIKYAMQSGPMLVIDGELHPAFNKKSKSKYTRSGVGVLNDSILVFAISHKKVNLYTFAKLFSNKLNCKNALYLDGAICRAYIPELNRKSKGGNFASIISVSRLN